MKLDIVDITRIIAAVQDQPRAQLTVNERQVDHPPLAGIRAPVFRLGHRHVGIAEKPGKVGLFGDQANGTGHGACPVKRALRSMNEEIGQNRQVTGYTWTMMIQPTGMDPHPLGAVPPRGILRSALVGREPAGTLRHLFSNLRDLTRGEHIGEDLDRNAEATRLRVDRTDGHGSYELYRLDRDLFILTIDCLFDSVREEVATGEGLLEIHVCLRGRLTMQLPNRPQPVIAQGPCLLLLYQPDGADLGERIEAGIRHTGVSLYCRPSYLSDLLRRNGIHECVLLNTIESTDPREVYHESLPLSAGLHFVATSLLQTPYQHGFRLLHAEAKALELLCRVLSPAAIDTGLDRAAATTTAVRQIDAVRRILGTQFAQIPHIRDLARRVGMSESKLKRAFKEHFGTTVFEYGLECRMRHALELLRGDSMTICQVAERVGYQHQTSFTAAFRDHFGFLPSEARTRPGVRG